MADSFRFDPLKMLERISDLEIRTQNAMYAYAETSAKKLESNAKANRPWTDRTGHAKQRLHGDMKEIPGTGFQLSLAHGVDYGIWLELAHEKRFAIIDKTIEYVGTFEIMPGWENLLDRLG